MNAIIEAVEDPIIQWVTFRLDGETYGINVMPGTGSLTNDRNCPRFPERRIM